MRVLIYEPKVIDEQKHSNALEKKMIYNRPILKTEASERTLQHTACTVRHKANVNHIIHAMYLVDQGLFFCEHSNYFKFIDIENKHLKEYHDHKEIANDYEILPGLHNICITYLIS